MDRRGSIPAVTVTFAVGGVLIAQGLARMPTLRDQVDASSAELGLALVGAGIGSIVAMPWTGRIVERRGSRLTVGAAALLTALAWMVVPLVDTPVQLGLVMFVMGAGVGVWDVGMNVQGHAVEQARDRSLMPWFHAGYSAGTLLGALVGVVTARAALPLSVQLPVAALLSLGVVLAAGARFLPDSAMHLADQLRGAQALGEHFGAGPPAAPHDTGVREGGGAEQRSAPAGAAAASSGGGSSAGITRAEILIGLICLSTAIGEGAANDWLALMLVDARDAPEAFGALTFAAFNLTMLIGRLVGGPAIERFGRVAVLRASGTCACVGVLTLSLVPTLWAAMAGGLLWGLGLATVFPATMSAAGEVPGRGQRAIGVVSTIGYGGFLLGAPTIGLTAEWIGLDRALLLIAGFAAVIVLLAHGARPRSLAPAVTQR